MGPGSRSATSQGAGKLIIEIALGILLAFVLIATMRVWLPLLLGAFGILLLLLIVGGVILIN